MISQRRKPRIAITVFRTAQDMFSTVERLEKAGCLRSEMMVITDASNTDQMVAFGLEAELPQHLSAFVQVMTEPAAIQLQASLARRELILIVPLPHMTTEQIVSRLLLEAPATHVQLHDLDDLPVMGFAIDHLSNPRDRNG